jgi:hypothetical protein
MLSPGVRIVVASDFPRVIRTGATFHSQKTSFTSLPRIQGAGPAQSAASRYAFNSEHRHRVEHVSWNPKKMGAGLRQGDRTVPRDKHCTGRPCCSLVAIATPDGLAGKLRIRWLSPGWLVPRAWRLRAPAGAVAGRLLHACRARLARGGQRFILAPELTLEQG